MDALEQLYTRDRGMLGNCAACVAKLLFNDLDDGLRVFGRRLDASIDAEAGYKLFYVRGGGGQADAKCVVHMCPAIKLDI